MSDINEEINRMVDKFSDDLRKKLLAYVGKRVTQAYKEGMKEGKPSASASLSRHTTVSSPPPASTRGRGRPAKVSLKEDDEAVSSRTSTSTKYRKRTENTSDEESD